MSWLKDNVHLTGYVTAVIAVMAFVFGGFAYFTDFPTRSFITEVAERSTQEMRIRIADQWDDVYKESTKACMIKSYIYVDKTNNNIYVTSNEYMGENRLLPNTESSIVSEMLDEVNDDSLSQSELTRLAFHRIESKGLNALNCEFAREHSLLPIEKLGIFAGFIGEELKKSKKG